MCQSGSINSVVSTLDDNAPISSTILILWDDYLWIWDKITNYLTEMGAGIKLGLVDAGTFNKTTNRIIALRFF